MTESRNQTEGALNERTLSTDAVLWQRVMRRVMRSITNAIGVLDPEGKFIMVNQRACEITGYSEDELIGSVFSILLSPDDLPPVHDRVMRTLTEGVPVSRFETRVVRKDGSKRIIRLSLEPLVVKENLRVAVGTAEDITERRESEQTLRETEERLRRVVANSPIILFALDRAGYFTLSEGKGLDTFGLKPGELVGRSVFDLCRDRPEILSDLRRAHAGEAFTANVQIGESAFEVWYSSLEDDRRQVVGVIGVATDISERTRAQEALRQSEDYNRDLVENSGLLIGTHDLEGNILSVNQSVINLTGYERSEEFQGLKIRDFLPEDVRNLFQSYLNTIIAEGHAHGMMKVVLGSGEERILEYHNSLRRGGLAVPIVRCIGWDITERKRSEDALVKSEERFLKAFNASPDPMVISRRDDGRLLDVNESFVTTTGYSREEALGRHALELGLLDNPADGSRLMGLLLERGRIYKEEVPFRIKGGEVRTGLLSLELIDVNGEQRILAVASDITEHKKRDEHVRAETAQLRQEIEAARRRLADSYGFCRIVGKSPPMLALIEEMRRVASEDLVTILIQGESGTGKELVAQAIHYESRRATRPFVPVNCAALPRELIESELFGYERGAFTGATAARKGLFEQADGGTIFLDEISEIDASAQVKLLRVLQERRVRHLGGSKDIPIDVRVIAASNRDLTAEVSAGRFREDLYYRIAVIKCTLPPLRERGQDDIRLLAEHFVSANSKKRAKQVKGFRRDAMEALLAHSWQGNVRELSNVIEGALVIEQGDEISVSSLRFDKFPERIPASAGQEPGLIDGAITLPLPAGITFDELAVRVKREIIKSAFAQCKGNKNEVAALLEISRFQLNRRIKSLGLRKWYEKEWGMKPAPKND